MTIAGFWASTLPQAILWAVVCVCATVLVLYILTGLALVWRAVAELLNGWPKDDG